MKQVVIMPGGFHPFHAGHYALYKQAQEAFPGADVYVAATNDTSARPFPFALKEKLAKLAGVKPGHFVQVKSPFRAQEITANLDPNNTQLIFVRSEKDADKPPQAGGVKKDGQPAYLQPLEGQGELAPMNRHAYMAYLPTVEFGPGMTSATEIRTAWPRLNEKRKTALVMSLYPATQKNPALAANVVKMLDTAMGTEVTEASFDKEAFRRHMADLAAREELRKTDPVSAKALDLRDKLPQTVKKKPEDDSIGINDPRHPGAAYTQGNQLDEFAPDEGSESRKFIPWPEFVEQVKQIVGKDFSCKENIVKSTIKARFVPHDPMEFGPTMLYSYYEARAGRNKGAISTRGSIQVGKYTTGGLFGQPKDQLLTSFNLLKGHPFERHFDLTFDNIYKIANIIMGNTEGALQFNPEIAEDTDGPVEAYGYVYDRRDQRVMWRKVFPSAEAAYAWADSKNATVLGTRPVEQTVEEDYAIEKISR
jgi:hypothetical protein